MSSCEFFSALSKVSKENEPFVIVTILQENVIERTIIVKGKSLLGFVSKDILDLADRSIKENKVLEMNLKGKRVIAEPIEPRPSIVLVGEGVIAKAINRLAVTMGYNTAVIGEGIREEEFSGARMISNNVQVMDEIVQEDSYVIVANEGGRAYDLDALFISLRRKAAFIGLLASQRRAALMISQLLKKGIDLNDIKERLHTPIGIDIGSKTAEEIALSVLAEVIKYMRNGSGKELREVKNPYVLLEDAMAGKIQDQCTFIPKSLS
ncbi:XdhC family protein [Acidianus sp. RZ1]|uniref:XdhC family protein n=1 Tax=Acidianus sp. RZ1 TaxID=1540082 RepID=UPI001492AC8C|nr:XdhC family protein [Acidianus sp. RZ1]NON62710.1 XdhC family protein [Acidianus sp. RZ1]